MPARPEVLRPNRGYPGILHRTASHSLRVRGRSSQGGKGGKQQDRKNPIFAGVRLLPGGAKKKTDLTARLVMASVIFLARPRDSRTNQGGGGGRIVAKN